jgi:hypothetical protein
MKTWLTQTLPPWSFTIAYLVLLAAVEGYRYWNVVSVNLDPDSLNPEFGPGFLPYLIVIAFAAAAYAWWRVTHFSPSQNTSYGAWLLTTPWMPGKALPLGPWHLGLQDAVPLLLLCVPAMYGDWQMVFIPLLTLLTMYALVLAVVLMFAGFRVNGCVLLITLIAVPRFWISDVLFYTNLIVIWICTTLAVKRLTQRFYEHPEEFVRHPLARESGSGSNLIQWPFDALLCGLPVKRNRMGDCLAFAALMAFGWYVVWALFERMTPQSEDYDFAAIVVDRGLRAMVVALALGRFFIYRACCRPPTRLFARIPLRTPILPHYDVVWAAPIVVVTVGFGGEAIIRAADWSRPVCEPIVLGACILIAALAGPSLNTWRLTGARTVIGPGYFVNRNATLD